MGRDIRIKGSRSSSGRTNIVEVDDHGHLEVAIRDSQPPRPGEASRYRFLSQLLDVTGDGEGSTDMNVDGSVTQQIFMINSHNDYDIRIMKLLIFIEDSAVTHNGFGALSALTNGIDLVVCEHGVETKIIDAGKKFADLIQQTLAAAPFGDGLLSFELTSTTGNQDAQVLPFDMGALVPGGVRVGKGTNDCIKMKINDDLSGLTAFTCRILGYRHYE